MPTTFELYWPRETGSDAGARFHADELEAAGLEEFTRQRVLALSGECEGVVQIRLPFLDVRECRRRGEMLRATRLIREGNTIRNVPANPTAALRDLAAHTLLAQVEWTKAPKESDRNYFRVWHSVAMELQRALRRWVPEVYFRESSKFTDRTASYPVLLYAASRPFAGRSKTEFAYDVADPQSILNAWRFSGNALQGVLSQVEERLSREGQPTLARRYAPIWYEDILRAVKDRPRPFIELLAQEAVLVNAVVNLGTARSMLAVKPFARSVNVALRRMAGMDMRFLAHRAIDEATRALERYRLAKQMPIAS